MGDWSVRLAFLGFALAVFSISADGEPFRIATYNLENYVDAPTPKRVEKSPESRGKVSQIILKLRPDVLAVQEVGNASALKELSDSLSREGLVLPYSVLISGSDTNIHIGLLSRYPFGKVVLYTNENFLAHGRRFHVARGFGRVEVKVSPAYSFTLIAAHLKSKRAMAEGDEEEIRLEEARLLREKIDQCFLEDPAGNLVVLGDFNDTVDSPPLRTVIGRGTTKLVDTRPGECSGDAGCLGNPPRSRRSITWTHFYAAQDTYRRIDFILISRAMAREWNASKSYVLATPDWGDASDHRPVVVEFEPRNP